MTVDDSTAEAGCRVELALGILGNLVDWENRCNYKFGTDLQVDKVEFPVDPTKQTGSEKIETDCLDLIKH